MFMCIGPGARRHARIKDHLLETIAMMDTNENATAAAGRPRPRRRHARVGKRVDVDAKIAPRDGRTHRREDKRGGREGGTRDHRMELVATQDPRHRAIPVRLAHHAVALERGEDREERKAHRENEENVSAVGSLRKGIHTHNGNGRALLGDQRCQEQVATGVCLCFLNVICAV